MTRRNHTRGKLTTWAKTEAKAKATAQAKAGAKAKATAQASAKAKERSPTNMIKGATCAERKMHFARDRWSQAKQNRTVYEVEGAKVDSGEAKEFVFTIENIVNDVSLSQSCCEVHEDGLVMIDSGASVNVCPKWFAETVLEKSDGSVELRGADGRTLQDYGIRHIRLRIGSRLRQCDFHVVEVTKQILSVSYLCENGFGHLEFTPLGRFHKICEMSEHCVLRYPDSDDHTALVGNDCTGSATSLPRRAYREGWQRRARDPKQVVLDPAGENLHHIFLDPLELNSVETEVTAAESPWQAGITEAHGRAFKMVFKKMLGSTRPKDKREFEECTDATVLARNVLLRTHGFSPYQHVFGRDPGLAFDVLVPEADVAVTKPVLDRPSERAIRQAARQASVDCQDDEAMRRALVARPRPWREFQVGDQVAFPRKGKGRGMRHGHARWHGRAVVLASCPGSKNVWVAHRHQLLKVSQEQLRMAPITGSVADDVVKTARQKVRCSQSIWTSPKVHHHRQQKSSPRQVRKREKNDMNDSKVVARDIFHKEALHSLTIQIASLLPMELRQKRKDQKCRRARRHEQAIVPWSAPAGEKRNLEVDEEMQSQKQCISERESPLLEEDDEILWCELLDSEEKVIDENEMNDDHEVVEMEQLAQRAARKGMSVEQMCARNP